MRTLRLLTWDCMPAPEAIAAAAERAGVRAEIEAISTNEALLERMDDDGPYDVVFPSDYMVERLRAADRLAPLDPDSLPLDRLADWARATTFDPGCRHSVPFAFGTTGFLHDERLSGATSWTDLFDPPAGARVGMLDEVREVVGAALMARGHELNATAPDALADAEALLREQRPRVARYASDDFVSPVVDGDLAAHHSWSGQAALAVRRNPRLGYVVPREGAVLWITTAAIPADAPDPDASRHLIRELMDPELASVTTARYGYATPNLAARARLDAELRSDTALFPSDETLARCHVARDLRGDEALIERVWQSVVATPA
jgi:spermidine/putrescine transport system substrate-binding protein